MTLQAGLAALAVAGALFVPGGTHKSLAAQLATARHQLLPMTFRGSPAIENGELGLRIERLT